MNYNFNDIKHIKTHSENSIKQVNKTNSQLIFIIISSVCKNIEGAIEEINVNSVEQFTYIGLILHKDTSSY